MIEWLTDRTGPPSHPMPTGPAKPPAVETRALPTLPGDLSVDPRDRLAHCRGQGLVDVIRLRCGLIPALPDAVSRPEDETQVTTILAEASSRGFKVIPWGGGTSVTGGVNVLAGEQPVLSLDLERMTGLIHLDETSGLATLGPGTTGPATERALSEHGMTLGHFPQSWELSTVGGWVATRSSGQESMGYGRIEDMVAGLRLVAPSGALEIEPGPASAAGPDLRQLALGSEGRLGVITRATLRVRPKPTTMQVEAALVRDLADGLATVRELVLSGIPLTLVRLSDADETQVAMAIGLADSPGASLVRRYLAMRGIGAESCLMLFGAAGERDDVLETMQTARALIRGRRGVPLGRGPGRSWLRDRYQHPYLRESLLDHGWATDTLETAAPWSRVGEIHASVGRAIATALEPEGERVPVLCHVSHPYRDGASAYFTFFFRCAAEPDHTIAQWAKIKRAANEALVAGRVTLSHHHGVGQWHAPWLAGEIGDTGWQLLAAAAQIADPDGVLNPHVLLNPHDNLER
jgi:alkyldihydroxyacetonephosphate synthase